MKLYRDDQTFIEKRKINLEDLELYDEEKVKLATVYLNQYVEESLVNQFDYISYVLEDHKKSDFASYNPNTGCISDNKKLYQKLKELGMKTYFVSCKASGYSNKAGDNIIKEAHIFLIYPSIRNNRIYYTIFDSGFRMEHPLSFYAGEDSPDVEYLGSGTAKVIYQKENDLYPYQFTVSKRINYQHQVIDADIRWQFNPYFETLHIDEYNEYVYRVIFSLKLMNYPKNLDQYLCIRSKFLDETLEIYTMNRVEEYTFEYLRNLNLEQLKELFYKFFVNANLGVKQLDRFIHNLDLLIHRHLEYVDKVISIEVLKEYRLDSGSFYQQFQQK